MGRTVISAFIAMLMFSLMPPSALGEDVLYHTPPHCWDKPRIFHSKGADRQRFDEAIARHLRITRTVSVMSEDRVKSPNGSYAFHLDEKNYEGSSDVYILIYTERTYFLQHAIVGVRTVENVSWVNEKTLYYRVWFGNMGGVDVLYDVELEEVIHYQPFYEGTEAFEQFQQCHDPGNAVPEACVPCPWDEEINPGQ